MNVSDIKGEEALDVLVDIIDPAAAILADKEIAEAYRADRKLEVVKLAIKNHKPEVVQIMAVLDGEDPKTYRPGVFTLPKKLLEIMNDPELSELFSYQDSVTSSGSVTESTEEKEA